MKTATKTSKAGIDLIKKSESLELESYLCPAGVWTIGYGNTRTACKGMIITESQAEDLLKSDLHIVEIWISSNFKLSQNKFDALVCLIFNIGIGQFRESKTCDIMRKDIESIKIAYEWIEFTQANGVRLRGLLLRRLEELQLYFSK